MNKPGRQAVRITLLPLAVLCSLFWQRPALAEVTEVTGSAYGVYTRISLFGGPATESGPAPMVALPPGGSADPITETDPDGASTQYGPAVIVPATALTVSTKGSTGPDGSVASSSAVEFNQDPEARIDPFSADDVLSTCTASEAGARGSVTLNNASLITSTDPDTGNPVEAIDLPVNPAPNTTFAGTIDHLGDTFRIVLNEQTTEGETLTVNAVHLYLGQDSDGNEVSGVAQGSAIVGQSTCGVSASGSGPSGTTPDTPETTEADEATAPGASTTSSQPADVVATEQVGADSGGAGGSLVVGALVGGGVLVALLVLRRRTGRPRRQ